MGHEFAGEVVALASYPDYDPNKPTEALDPFHVMRQILSWDPFRELRRRLLVRLGVRSGKGRVETEVFAEHALRDTNQADDRTGRSADYSCPRVAQAVDPGRRHIYESRRDLHQCVDGTHGGILRTGRGMPCAPDRNLPSFQERFEIGKRAREERLVGVRDEMVLELRIEVQPGLLEERRQRIAEGLANAEKIKAELARTEAQRLEVLSQANTQATKLIERIAVFRLKASATMPVRIGAKAAPVFSTKYSTACAVERTSGTVTS